MEYVVGIVLALAICLAATLIGFDRDRAFYPTLLTVIASYYGLFAVIGGSNQSLMLECLGIGSFVVVAILGFRMNLWWIVGGLAVHGVFDVFHSQVIADAGVPLWWPAFCLSYDLVAATYLAVLLVSTRLRAEPSAARSVRAFARRIRPYVNTELAAARACERNGNIALSFARLERAHVLGQASTLEHVRVHMRMLLWSVRHRRVAELAGQLMRIIGAAILTAPGVVPEGNTGGVNVSPWRQMTVPADLAARIAAAMAAQENDGNGAHVQKEVFAQEAEAAIGKAQGARLEDI
jgi:hypothetical protein